MKYLANSIQVIAVFGIGVGARVVVWPYATRLLYPCYTCKQKMNVLGQVK